MKRFLVIILAATICWLPVIGTGMFVAGCSSGCTTSQKSATYKTLNIIATSVDAGMKAFADAVVAGKVPQATQDKVKALHGSYTKSMQAAVLAAHFDTSKIAPDDLKALASELLKLITEAIA